MERLKKKRILWGLGGAIVIAIILSAIFLWLLIKPRTFIAIENTGEQPVLIMNLTYNSVSLLENYVLDDSVYFHFLPAAWMSKITVILRRNGQDNEEEWQFAVKQNWKQDCYFFVYIYGDRVEVTECSVVR